MKTKPVRSLSPATEAKHREIVAKISAAQKRVEAARKIAKEAKAEFKRVRKTHRQARKSAKEARKEYKALKKMLVAAHAATVRAKTTKAKKPVRVRRTTPARSAPADFPLPTAIIAAVPMDAPPVAPPSDGTAQPETRAES